METEQRVVAGRYRLLEPLGSGGMGTVWRADDLVLGRSVAVKEVSFPHGLPDADRDVLRERTRREARAAARLDHPSAVTVFDVVEEGDAPYLVMELVEARTLAEVVREDGALSAQRTAQVGLDLLGALEAAHAQGIGWSTERDGDGWTVALPPGYEQTRPGEYRQASTGRTLRVETGPGQPDAVADRERQEKDLASRHPSYERIRIEPVDYRGYEAADCEFTYEGLHVINRVFVVDGTGHSLFFQAPRQDFPGAEEDFREIAATFRPVGG